MKYCIISDDVKLGTDVKIYSFVNLYGCSIGDRSKIGAFVEIQKNVTVGSDCKISSHSFLCEGVNIGNGVFIGHGVMFINDKNPRAINSDGSLQTEADWHCEKTILEDNVSIGSGATIMCGIRIGKGAVVGAGAVVTKNVGQGVTVIGVPAKQVKLGI